MWLAHSYPMQRKWYFCWAKRNHETLVLHPHPPKRKWFIARNGTAKMRISLLCATQHIGNRIKLCPSLQSINNFQSASLNHRANAWGPFLTSPQAPGRTSQLGVNLAPRGKIWPLGCSPLRDPQGWTLYWEEWRGEERISPPGDNFTPMEQNSPWGSKFAPR
jgi:hypothetical protein